MIRVVSLLPLGFSRWAARKLAVLFWLTGSRAALITRTNLRLCYPNLGSVAIRSLMCASLAETACILAETGMLFYWPRQRWLAVARNRPDPEGVEALAKALDTGRGVLILAPHFGNWEYLALYLGQFDAAGLYEPPRLDWLDAPLRSARERSGMTLLPLDRGGLRAAYRHLRGGGCLALLPDQVPRRTAGVYAPFFGIPALTMTFAHRLIQQTRPVVLLASARRVREGFEVGFVDPGDAVYASSARASAAAMNEAIERLVREDPAQYQWEYKRFRRQPPGTPDPYPRPASASKRRA